MVLRHTAIAASPTDTPVDVVEASDDGMLPLPEYWEHSPDLAGITLSPSPPESLRASANAETSTTCGPRENPPRTLCGPHADPAVSAWIEKAIAEGDSSFCGQDRSWHNVFLYSEQKLLEQLTDEFVPETDVRRVSDEVKNLLQENPQLRKVVEDNQQLGLVKDLLEENQQLRKHNADKEDEIQRLKMSSTAEIRSVVQEVQMGNWTSKVLLLTEEHLQALEQLEYETLLDALDIDHPRLVISLFASVTYLDKSCAWVEATNNRPLQKRLRQYSDLSEDCFDDVERKLHFFLKTSVLPLAIEAQALVLVNSSDCLLTKVFSDVCEMVLLCMGKLPFSVLTLACMHHMPYAAMNMPNQGFVTPNLLRDNKQFEEVAIEQTRWLSKHASIDSNMSDCTLGSTHYIICTGTVKAVNRYRNILTEKLSKRLPCFALATLAGDLDFVADYVARGMPLMLLDTRPATCDFRRAYSRGAPDSTTAAATEQISCDGLHCPGEEKKRIPNSIENEGSIGKIRSILLNLTVELARRGTWDVHSRCTLALIRKHLQQEPAALETESSRPLHEEIEITSQKASQASRNKMLRLASVAADQFMHHHETSKKIRLRFQLRYLDRLIHDLDLIEEKDVDKLKIWLQDRSMEWSILLRRMPCSTKRNFNWIKRGIEESEHLMLVRYENHAVNLKGTCKLWFEKIKLRKDDQSTDVREVTRQLKKLLDDEYQMLREQELVMASQFNRKRHAKLMDLLCSPNLFTALLDNEDLSTTLHQMIGRSRLPRTNSIQALQLMRDAWNTFDTFMHAAQRCKIYAWLAIGLLLLINFAISVLTVICLNERQVISTETLSVVTVGLELFGSLLASVTMFFNPLNRWIRLKSAAMGLESELWRFRTRTGTYKVDINRLDDRAGEERLYQYLQEVKRTVSKQISSSPLTTQDIGHKKYLVHGQYQDNPDESRQRLLNDAAKQWGAYWPSDKPKDNLQNDEMITMGCSKDAGQTERMDDDHCSPLEPLDYLKLRVFPQLLLYRKENPRYKRTHTVVEMLLILSQLTGVVLGVVGRGSWIGIIASVGTTITSLAAWQGFHKKHELTSSAVESLDSLLLWWQFLQFFDRYNVQYVDRLVDMCEGVIQKRQEGDVTTSAATAIEIQRLLESAQERASQIGKQKRMAGSS